MFNGILTGQQLWEKIVIENLDVGNILNEQDYSKEDYFNVEIQNKKLKNGSHYIIISRLDTQEETNIKKERLRVTKLKQIISDKKLLDEPCIDEQAELKSLLLGTHDEYIQTKEQEAIDAYTLELIEGGIL